MCTYDNKDFNLGFILPEFLGNQKACVNTEGEKGKGQKRELTSSFSVAVQELIQMARPMVWL